jgi:hypothetical protein
LYTSKDEQNQAPIFKDLYGNNVHWTLDPVLAIMNDPVVMEMSTNVPGFKYYQPNTAQTVVYNYTNDLSTNTTSVYLMGISLDYAFVNFACKMTATPNPKSLDDQFSSDQGLRVGTYQCVFGSTGNTYKYQMSFEDIDGGFRFIIQGIEYPQNQRLSEAFTVQLFFNTEVEVLL